MNDVRYLNATHIRGLRLPVGADARLKVRCGGETARALEIMRFFETYTYRPVVGPVNEETRVAAAKEYIKARERLKGDYITLTPTVSVGMNYRPTVYGLGDGTGVRYDLTMELYLHAPAQYEETDTENRLLPKAIGVRTPDQGFDMTYAGTIREIAVDMDRGWMRIVAGTHVDCLILEFTLDADLRVTPHGKRAVEAPGLMEEIV